MEPPPNLIYAGCGRMDRLATLLGSIHESLPQAANTLYQQYFVTAESFVEADERHLQLWGFTALQAAAIHIACKKIRAGKSNFWAARLTGWIGCSSMLAQYSAFQPYRKEEGGEGAAECRMQALKAGRNSCSRVSMQDCSIACNLSPANQCSLRVETLPWCTDKHSPPRRHLTVREQLGYIKLRLSSTVREDTQMFVWALVVTGCSPEILLDCQIWGHLCKNLGDRVLAQGIHEEIVPAYESDGLSYLSILFVVLTDGFYASRLVACMV